MINCYECNSKCSSKALECKNCGAPLVSNDINTELNRLAWFQALLSLGYIFIGLFVFYKIANFFSTSGGW